MGKKKKEIPEEKLRDMIRSILPSKARVRARRAKAAQNRMVRRRVRMTLHADDAEETKADLYEEAYQSTNVWDRRGADKLNHFMRWCRSWTRGMTERQALDAVRAVLPRNLIGDHAYAHWEGHRKRVPTHYYYPKQDRQSLYDKTRHRFRQALSVDPNFQRELNDAIKVCKLSGEPCRFLLGLHDVDAFLHDVFTDCALVCEWRVLLGLLDEAGQHRPHCFATPIFWRIAPMWYAKWAIAPIDPPAWASPSTAWRSTSPSSSS